MTPSAALWKTIFRVDCFLLGGLDKAAGPAIVERLTANGAVQVESYGPKFVENIVQATSRDILAEAMLRLDAHGYKIVMHVHDEVVIEAPADASLAEISAKMSLSPTWAKGLLLRADGYVTDFYRKD